MDEYLQKMILAYFKEHSTYSTIDLSRRLGVSVERTVEIIEKLVDLEEVDIKDGVCMRSRWIIDENIPIFKGEGRNYIEKLINFKENENEIL